MSFVHKNMYIRGKVQGVYFRASTVKEARKYKIKGFVRNEPDGSVYAEAEGEEADVQQLVRWCKNGPPMAKVTSIKVEDGDIRQFPDFQAR